MILRKYAADTRPEGHIVTGRDNSKENRDANSHTIIYRSNAFEISRASFLGQQFRQFPNVIGDSRFQAGVGRSVW